ncbi:MAG: Phenylpropionate dioxygenase and related ring-hydroxylating dioxygenase, large terminal subunit [Ramlibacter sp.]|nr:Phenylpropionate dioxygenase and related ring-hydroxylating dioxygenase, large terminal subunit [Ramlibacter sp.]
MSFLKNQWYCAGFGHDLAERPLAVRILDEPIVLYRLPDGRPAALHDRCPHRFAPLSRGKVCGESLQCGYHGLEFGADGSCTSNPWGDHAIPKAARVRSYPLVERDMFLWIWMGDPALAREEEALDLGTFFNRPQHPVVYDSYKLEANYEVVVDNLLDLSHGIYLHGGTLTNGKEGAGKMRVEMKQEGDTVIALHRRDNELPAPFLSKAWGGRTERVNHRSDMHWHPAGNLVHVVGITEIGQPQGRDDGVYLHVAHILTPISERQTHYHWIAARNFALDDAEAGKALHAAIHRAFTQEDEPMIAAVQERMGTTDLMALRPVLLPGDAAALRARRITDQLRKRELDAAPVAPVTFRAAVTPT